MPSRLDLRNNPWAYTFTVPTVVFLGPAGEDAEPESLVDVEVPIEDWVTEMMASIGEAREDFSIVPLDDQEVYSEAMSIALAQAAPKDNQVAVTYHIEPADGLISVSDGKQTASYYVRVVELAEHRIPTLWDRLDSI